MIGPGGKPRPTETKDRFQDSAKTQETRFELAPERIEFFKGTHFVIGSEGEARKKLMDKTSMKQELPAYKGVPKPNAKQCSAYKLRFGKAQLGSTNPQHPSSFVTTGQTLQKWI